MQLTNEQIRQMAQELSCGMTCYYNPENGEMVFLPDFEDMEGELLDAWSEEMSKVRKDRQKYRQIQRPPSSEAFDFMVEFVETLPVGDETREKLAKALNQSRPIREFKSIIDRSEVHREKWYRYHDQKMQEWVRAHLNDTSKNKKRTF